jgi:hypothetical protein
MMLPQNDKDGVYAYWLSSNPTGIQTPGDLHL